MRRKSVLFKDQYPKKIEGSYHQSSILGGSGTALQEVQGTKARKITAGQGLRHPGACLLLSSLSQTPRLASTSWATISWSTDNSPFLQVKQHSNSHAVVLVGAHNLRIRREGAACSDVVSKSPNVPGSVILSKESGAVAI